MVSTGRSYGTRAAEQLTKPVAIARELTRHAAIHVRAIGTSDWGCNARPSRHRTPIAGSAPRQAQHLKESGSNWTSSRTQRTAGVIAISEAYETKRACLLGIESVAKHAAKVLDDQATATSKGRR